MVDTASFGDRGLVAAACAGDESAFDALVGPLIEPGFKLAVVMLRNPDEAHDAVQEATIKAWQRLDRLRDDRAVRQWFLAIVANQCRTVRRGRWFATIRLAFVVTRTEERASEAVIDLHRELAALPQTDRAALFLFYYLDLPLGEVGRVLGITPQAAKSRVHRAVTKLRLGMLEGDR